MGGVVKGAGVELCVICVQLSLNKAWSFENIPFCSATHVLWISRTYVLTIEAAERSVLLSGRESTIWFTYIVAGWQARAHYDLACSLALIYCTSSFYVRFKAGSVHHIGSFIIYFFLCLYLTSVILMPYMHCFAICIFWLSVSQTWALYELHKERQVWQAVLFLLFGTWLLVWSGLPAAPAHVAAYLRH